MVRPCPRCKSLVPSNEWEAHKQAHKNAEKPSTAERGYGTEHRRLRAHYQRLLDRGTPISCARCGQPIRPGEDWDLGHVDGDKSRYQGPEHRYDCNRATATHAKQRRESSG